MDKLATVLVLAPPMHGQGGWLASDHQDLTFLQLHQNLARLSACGFDALLLAPDETAQALKSLPAGCKHACAPLGMTVAQNVAAGVLASSLASGWVVIRGDLPCPADTDLIRLSRAVQTYPIARVQGPQQLPWVVGYGRELFSELIQLQQGRDLARMASRYPTLDLVALTAPAWPFDSTPGTPHRPGPHRDL